MIIELYVVTPTGRRSRQRSHFSESIRLRRPMMHRPPQPVSHKVCETEDLIRLDEVDFGRQVARDFETNFLLANFGL